MLIPLILVSTAMLAQSAPAAPQPPAGPDALAQAYYLFLQGRAQEDKGDPQGAIATYRKALTLAPSAADVHAELAGVYARLGRASESISEANAALSTDTNNHDAHRILGFVQAALADRAATPGEERTLKGQAIDHLERSLAAGVRDPSAELVAGRLYVETGVYAKGIIHLQLFLLDRPDYPEAMLLLAQAFDASGKPSEASSVLEDLVSVQPTEAQPRSLLAGVYERQGRWNDAAAAWGELARRNPQNTLYQTHQAMAKVNGGDVDGGRQQLADLAKAAPRDVGAWYLLAQVEARGGHAAAAEDAAKHITDLDANDARGAIALAAAKTAQKDYKGAADVLDARVKAATDRDVSSGLYGRMVADLSAALEQAGDRPRAIQILESARKRDPDDADTAFQLAGVYERDKKFDSAEQMFRDIVTKDPTNASALNYLGYMLADRGQKLPEAVDLIKRALSIESGNPNFLDSLGWAYLKSAQFGPAREPLEKAATALPKSSVIQDHLAQLYFQLKLYKDAASAWTRALAGDREGIDAADITKKRDKALELAGR